MSVLHPQTISQPTNQASKHPQAGKQGKGTRTDRQKDVLTQGQINKGGGGGGGGGGTGGGAEERRRRRKEVRKEEEEEEEEENKTGRVRCGCSTCAPLFARDDGVRGSDEVPVCPCLAAAMLRVSPALSLSRFVSKPTVTDEWLSRVQVVVVTAWTVPSAFFVGSVRCDRSPPTPPTTRLFLDCMLARQAVGRLVRGGNFARFFACFLLLLHY